MKYAKRSLLQPLRPNEAAIKVTRLLELRRKTREIVHSVNLSTLLRLKSPIWKIVHSERRAAGSFSEVTPASALFDAAWYLGQYPEVAALECDPLTHYLRRGAHEGRDPNPVFNTAWYLANNPNVAAADLNPLEHYLEFGARAGRDPSPLFDSSWYLEQNPDLGSDVNPLRHYLECGALRGTRSASSFQHELGISRKIPKSQDLTRSNIT